MTTESDQQTEPTPAPAPNPIAGYADCPLCAPNQLTAATVLRSKKKRFYLNCPVHNIQLMTSNACQQWIHENMRDTPQRKAGDPKPTPAPKPATSDDPKPTKPAKKDFLGDW